eukprot:9364042-Pyramimonas_sp.AAC.1
MRPSTWSRNPDATTVGGPTPRSPRQIHGSRRLLSSAPRQSKRAKFRPSRPMPAKPQQMHKMSEKPLQ